MKFLIALIAASVSFAALADTPLTPPEMRTVCSRSGKICATSDPTTNLTVVTSKSSQQKPWTIPGWHRWLFVSDDGRSLVVGYGGMNLVPIDVSLQEPVLFFYHDAKLVRTVTLGDLYKRKSQLTRTASHLAWVETLGINQANQLVVRLINGDEVAFDVSTGQVQPLGSGGI